MRECNVLIVGAGLSGSSAAYHLTRNGVRDVVVIERMSEEKFGKYHRTCGEAVSRRLLDASGVPKDCIVRDVSSISIRFGDTDILVPSEGHIIDRERLLSSLREGSDSDYVRGSVRHVRAEDEGFTVECEDEVYRCRYLIGADGVFSVVRKDIFGYSSKERFAIINNIVSGNGDERVLGFEISPIYPGGYRWDFPSKDGKRSVGYVKGTGNVEDCLERGTRFVAIGRNGPVVEGHCCLVGDAAVLINPVCFAGIGAALLSGRKAAECIAAGNLRGYQKWVGRDRMFNEHIMRAHDTFKEWSVEDYADSMRPFRKGYSLMRGAYAMMRRPRWANVYMSIWVSFNRGW